jgi:hypothetical protein
VTTTRAEGAGIVDAANGAVTLPIEPASSLTHRSVVLAVGAGAHALALLDRATGGVGRIPVIVDAGIGAATVTAQAVGSVAATAGAAGSRVARLAAHPPLVPRRFAPGTLVDALIERGRLERALAGRVAGSAWRTGTADLVPEVLDDVLDQVDLTEIVLSRVDLARLIGAALDSIDLTQLVLTRVELERVVASALETIDLTEVVLTRVDLDRIIESALDSMDLTDLVLARVDLARVVDSAVASVDLTEIVLTRVDLVRIAEYVVAAIDLPEIIRESSGGIATEAVRGVRMQSIDADERVQHFVDRLMRRRQERNSAAVEQDPQDAS